MFGGYMFCSYNMFGSYNIMLGFYDNMFKVQICIDISFRVHDVL